jgi:hypothetical protein
MTDVIEETAHEASQPGKLVQVAGMTMSLMGSSYANAHNEEHIDHGYAPARWAAAAISILGFLIGGIAFPFGIWELVVVGGLLQIVAVIVNLSLNAAGYGAKANDQWAAAKARAKAARAAS